MMKRECSGLAPVPHVSIVELCEEDEFLVIGSDGLFEVFGNHRQLIKVRQPVRSPWLVSFPPCQPFLLCFAWQVVKDTLRATGSVDETAKSLVRDTVRSPFSNDNVSVVLVLFNQFGVVTGHAGSCGGWRGFASASV